MSLVKCVTAAVLAAAVGGVVVAADAIKPDLKDFKWKCKFDNGESLGGYDENRFFFYSFGTATGDVTIPEDGEYTVTVEASCSKVEKEYAKFKLSVGETVVAKEHECTTEDAKKYAFTAKLKKGKQPLVIEFLNDKFKEGEYDLNLYVSGVTLEKKVAPPEKKEPPKVVPPETKKSNNMKQATPVTPPATEAAPCSPCATPVATPEPRGRRAGLFGNVFGRTRCRGCS